MKYGANRGVERGNDMDEIKMEHSKYRIVYDKKRQWEYKVMRGNENVTRTVRNNAMDDVVYELMNIREMQGRKG